MKYLSIICLSFFIWGCSDSETESKSEGTATPLQKQEAEKPVDKKDLVEVRGNTYTEYYDAGKTKIKFQGEQDEEKRRHGKWTHFHKNGLEASITFYTNGIRNGHSTVKHPNGSIFYHGEYTNDKPSGIWKYYDEQGVLTTEKNYDED